jgi:hypothetical protein
VGNFEFWSAYCSIQKELLEKLQIQPEQTIPVLGQGVEKAAKEFIQTCYNDFKKESDGYMYMKLDKMAKFRGKNKKVCLWVETSFWKYRTR